VLGRVKKKREYLQDEIPVLSSCPRVWLELNPPELVGCRCKREKLDGNFLLACALPWS